jgi:hypothetical protein
MKITVSKRGGQGAREGEQESMEIKFRRRGKREQEDKRTRR